VMMPSSNVLRGIWHSESWGFYAAERHAGRERALCDFVQIRFVFFEVVNGEKTTD
jgi:hypothetical protein